MVFITPAIELARRHWKALGAGLIVLLLLIWGMRVDHLRAGWKARHENLSRISGDILGSIRAASGQRGLRLENAAEQVTLIGAAKREWQATSELQSSRIDALAIESARLKALGDELRVRAEAAIAKRDSAINRLKTQALDPGERADCAAQIFAANAALDLLYEEGL